MFTVSLYPQFITVGLMPWCVFSLPMREGQHSIRAPRLWTGVPTGGHHGKFVVNHNSRGTGLAQRTATSTPEAEYVTMAHGLKELLWTYQTLLTIGVNIKLSMHIMEDNQACIRIVDNQP